MRRAAFVLVGGASTRMGRDKALLPYREGVLVEHVAEAARRAAGSVTLVGNPERYRRLGLPVIADSEPGLGPLAGIVAALETTRARWNLMLACDMPNIAQSFLISLFEVAETAPVEPDCVAPQCRGRLEPLCAVYHRRSAGVLRAALAERELKLQRVLRRLNLVPWPVAEPYWFRNVNTPEDWRAHDE
jgi:molybdopterin-guanine dinucleotide biosynthesis protein A